MERLFMDICMDLWSGDVTISYKGFREEVLTRIANVKSHMGKEAHDRETRMGIIDNTGMSIEEQDDVLQKEIDKYQKLLDYLDDDSNWTI